jgi:3-deoxy-D-manno-octulosonic-acid transferase
MYFLYSLLTALGMLLAAPYFLFTGFRRGQSFAVLRQRFGWGYPPELLASEGRSIWIHAVSVGEVLAVLPLARRLKEQFPDHRLVISTTTVTGQRLASERLPFAAAVFYYPLDWGGPVRRAFRAARPDLILVAETEIWPNFLREARLKKVPVAFVNGRLSARSYHGFLRARSLTPGMLGKFQKKVLADASLYLMQSEADAARILDLGAPSDRIVVTGNLKYDLAPPHESDLSRWLAAEMRRAERGPLIVAGSVVAGEESQVLDAFAEIENRWPAALLVLAPRKPNRFNAAAEEVQNSGREVVRRSTLSSFAGASKSPLAAPRSVLLLDSVGELASLYALADAVFVGGSLVPAGGHNILEPGIVGRPPVFGPSMENFKEMAVRFLEAGAGLQVSDSAQLAAAWKTLLDEPVQREKMGSAARELVERYRGATDRVLAHVAALIESRRELAATARGGS